jgi:hypothetical protein
VDEISINNKIAYTSKFNTTCGNTSNSGDLSTHQKFSDSRVCTLFSSMYSICRSNNNYFCG